MFFDRLMLWAAAVGRTFGTDSPFPQRREIDAAKLKSRDACLKKITIEYIYSF
jgi:hypothetical protein